TRENLRMAPNSNFDYAIGMHNQAFKPGEYTFKGVAHSGKREWRFEKDFEIKGEESRKYNQEAVSLEKDHTDLYLIIGGIVVFVLLVVIILLIRKLKQKPHRDGIK
uniref:WxL protein host-binding domain-containing protein n=1 Tax=Lactococcus garvieae TaxID=1363 RepID=UPI0025507D78